MSDLTTLDVCGLLRRQCREAGGQSAWATANGVSPQYVCDVLNARREPGDMILAYKINDLLTNLMRDYVEELPE